MPLSSSFSKSVANPVAEETPPASGASSQPANSDEVPLWRCGVVVMIAVVVGISYWMNPPLNLKAEAGVVMELPIIVGDYFGKQGEITKVELDTLPKDTEFARRYYDDGRGHQIECSIVLSGSEQRSIHRPEACLVGQGWTIVGQENLPIPLLSGHNLVARKLSLERQVVAANDERVTVRAFYIYWFVGQNVTTPSHFSRILLSNWDRVIHNRAHRWAYVTVFSLMTEGLRPDGLNADQTQAVMLDFTKQIVPTFQISEMPPKA